VIREEKEGEGWNLPGLNLTELDTTWPGTQGLACDAPPMNARCAFDEGTMCSRWGFEVHAMGI
jgi:hypothetical protein